MRTVRTPVIIFFFCFCCKEVGRFRHYSIADKKVPLPLKVKKNQVREY